MSSSENTKYWYFRFTKDFFRDKAIRNLKYIPVVGYQYICIYLEMCALCLDDGGYILKIPKITLGDSYITYISNEIGEEAKIVQQAVGYFIKEGFIEVMDDTLGYALSFEKMKNNMGKSSKDADRKRLSYAKDKIKELEYSNDTIKEDERKNKGAFYRIIKK